MRIFCMNYDPAILVCKYISKFSTQPTACHHHAEFFSQKFYDFTQPSILTIQTLLSLKHH